MGTLGTHGTPYLLPNGFDRADDALRSEAARCRGDERAILNRRCVDRDLRPPAPNWTAHMRSLRVDPSAAARSNDGYPIRHGPIRHRGGHTKFFQTRACSSPCPHPPSAPHGCPRESEARHRHRAARTRPSRSFFCDPRSRFGGAERPRRHVERPPGCARGMIKLALRAIPTYTRGAMPGSHPGMRQTHSIIAERFGRS